MNDEQENQPGISSYLMVFAIWPVIVILAVIAAVMAYAYFMDKGEYDSDDTREQYDDAKLIEPSDEWHSIIAFFESNVRENRPTALHSLANLSQPTLVTK